MSATPKPPKATLLSQIAKQVGAPPALLPGESEEAYNSGLQSTIDELQAKTHLQVYLAEKIFQCLWWIRRYEKQKQSVILEGIVGEMTNYATTETKRLALRELVFSENWNSPSLQAELNKSGHTQSSVVATAMSERRQQLMTLDQQIALRIKTLTQLQQSYEALVNRSILQERLKLQNDLIKRDLQAVELTHVNVVDPEAS